MPERDPGDMFRLQRVEIDDHGQRWYVFRRDAASFHEHYVFSGWFWLGLRPLWATHA